MTPLGSSSRFGEITRRHAMGIGTVLGASKEGTSPAMGRVKVSFDHVGVTPGRAVWASIVQIDPTTLHTVDNQDVQLLVQQVVPNYADFGADVQINCFLVGALDTSPPTSWRVSLFILIDD